MVDQHHLAPASGSGERTHQTGSTGANDYNVSNGHSVVPRSSGHDRSHAPRQAMHKPVFDSGRRSLKTAFSGPSGPVYDARRGV
ncbi:hypothetical protein ALO91_103204 [Pseudomonas syringae pv. aceris]|uniref:Uncharacterized protein n=1 Tax=Pseudomonas syringae pv. aceris TaxID=199198 RepID=A0A0P9IT94_PSESX|nr:hypothetical protein ALO91_103204 [Pseudomonas syringae pv. aceris]RMR48945.1 hypothetical protein ALP85_102483 [Pseudomonas syringae pv. syringae]